MSREIDGKGGSSLIVIQSSVRGVFVPETQAVPSLGWPGVNRGRCRRWVWRGWGDEWARVSMVCKARPYLSAAAPRPSFASSSGEARNCKGQWQLGGLMSAGGRDPDHLFRDDGKIKTKLKYFLLKRKNQVICGQKFIFHKFGGKQPHEAFGQREVVRFLGDGQRSLFLCEVGFPFRS